MSSQVALPRKLSGLLVFQATAVEDVDLCEFSSAAELEGIGLDRLKAALLSRGLKCGGTLQERSERLFSVKGLKPEEIDPALKSKGGKVKKSKANTGQ